MTGEPRSRLSDGVALIVLGVLGAPALGGWVGLGWRWFRITAGWA